MTNIELKIREWAESKKIFSESSPLKQSEKTLEEANELLRAAIIENIGIRGKEDVLMEAGDVGVTLVIVAAMHGLTLEYCLGLAYEKINKRTGEMVDGKFVKDEQVKPDLTPNVRKRRPKAITPKPKPTHKKCKYCGETYPWTSEHFHWWNQEKGKLHVYCKSCKIAYVMAKKHGETFQKIERPMRVLRKKRLKEEADKAILAFRSDKISTKELTEKIMPLYGVATSGVVAELRAQMGL